ncbi:HAX1 protein, partial [Psilopogon haemacephalus]|nr:HAX1 protein [Psilopogon haemacephalus]
PPPARPRDPLFGGAAWEEEDEEDEDSPGLAQPPRDFGFGFTPGGSRGAFAELFRDMSELLGAFGGVWAGPLQPFAPALPGPGPGPAPGDGSRTEQSLRDSMLKPSESSEPERTPGGSAGTGE